MTRDDAITLTSHLHYRPLSLTRLSRSSPGLIPPLVTLAAQREGREPTGRTRSESGREVSDRHAERRDERRESAGSIRDRKGRSLVFSPLRHYRSFSSFSPFVPHLVSSSRSSFHSFPRYTPPARLTPHARYAVNGEKVRRMT